MAVQGILFRSLHFFSNSKLLLNNRINHVNHQPTFMGLCQDIKDRLQNLPEKPKKPPTAYIKFLMEKRPILKQEDPKISSVDLIKQLAEEWRNLSTQAKEKYVAQVKVDKVKYDEKMLSYSASLTPEQEQILKELKEAFREGKKKKMLRKMNKEENKPKKPIPLYGMFVQEQSQITNKNFNILFKELKEQWSHMSQDEKEKYKIQYERNKEKFEIELEQWELKMLKEGKEELVRLKTIKSFPHKVSGKTPPKPQ